MVINEDNQVMHMRKSPVMWQLGYLYWVSHFTGFRGNQTAEPHFDKAAYAFNPKSFVIFLSSEFSYDIN